MTLIVTNMKSQTAETTVEKLGPRIDSPDDAINGFLRSNNIKSIDDCDILDDKKVSGMGILRQFLQKRQ